MEFELMNVCMECGLEWEENNAISCPKCHCADFYTYREMDYDNLSLEDCINLYTKKIACVCDGDNYVINFMEE